jgi:hypothetical protein
LKKTPAGSMSRKGGAVTLKKGCRDKLMGRSGLRTYLQISTNRRQSSRKNKKKDINPHTGLSDNKEDFTKNQSTDLQKQK